MESNPIDKLIAYLKLDDVTFFEEHEKVRCLCPLPDHDDTFPSFYISYRPGFLVYKCFGCTSREGKGSLVKLVSILDDCSFDEAKATLMTIGFEFDAVVAPDESLIDFDEEPVPYSLDKYDLTGWEGYLADRHIPLDVGRKYGVRYKFPAAVVMPLKTQEGIIVAAQLRSIARKEFWWEPKKTQRAKYFFGMDVAATDRSYVYVVESAYDVMYLRRFGINAVALVGEGFSKEQRKFLLGFSEVVLLLDWDLTGARMTELLGESLHKEVMTFVVKNPNISCAKDIGQIPPACARKIATDVETYLEWAMLK